MRRRREGEGEQGFLWYLRDADAVGYDSKGWEGRLGGSRSVDEDRLGGRERLLVERERNLQALEKRAAAVGIDDHHFEDRERALLGRERAVQSLEEREASLVCREKQLGEQEKVYERRANDLSEREAKLGNQHAQRPGSSGGSSEVAMLRAENDRLHLQIRTSSLEREVEKVKERLVSTNNAEVLRKLEAEKQRLKVLLQTHQNAGRFSPSPIKRGDTSIPNSPVSFAPRSPGQSISPTPGQQEFQLRVPPSRTPRPDSYGPESRSSTATSVSSQRHTSGHSPLMTIRASSGTPSVMSSAQRSYDSRFSGWPEDDESLPGTPSRRSKRTTSSALGSAISTPINKIEDSQKDIFSPDSSSPQTVGNGARKTDQRSRDGRESTSATSGRMIGGIMSVKSKPPQRSALGDVEAPSMPPVADDGDVLVYPCGHKIYKPPRKLNRTVSGYLYE